MARSIKSDLRLEVESFGVKYQTYMSRMRRGWSHTDALNPQKTCQKILSLDELRLVYAMLDDRDYHLNEAKKLTNKKIAEKMGISFSTITKIGTGERYGRPKD